MKKILLFAFLIIGLANATTTYCLQQNVTPYDCGLNSSIGRYSTSFWGINGLTFDNDYTTYETGAYLYINYSKLLGQTVTNAKWSVAGYNGEYRINNATNFTIPTNCLSQNPIQLQVSNPAGNNYFYCWNSIGYELLGGGGGWGNRIYDEAMYWESEADANLVYCGSAPNNTMAMSFIQKNFNNLTTIRGKIAINITVQHYIGNTTNHYFESTTGNLSLCFNNAIINETAQGVLSFVSNNYLNGTYVFTGNITFNQNISLYNVLDDGTQELTVIRILSGDNTLLPGAVLRIYVNDLIQGNQTQIQGVIADSEAKTVQYLVPNVVTYSFEIDWGGNTYYIPKILLTCTSTVCPPYSLDLKAVGIDASDYYKTLDKVSASCAVNSTNWLICSVNDSSGLVKTFQLIVDKRNVLNLTRICDQNCTSAQCILRCNLGNTTNALYQYAVKFYASPDQDALTGMLDYLNRLINWGTMGVFLALLLLLTLYFAGSWNPTVAMVISYVGLIFSYLIGLLPIGIEPLIGLGFVIAVIVWKMGI